MKVKYFDLRLRLSSVLLSSCLLLGQLWADRPGLACSADSALGEKLQTAIAGCRESGREDVSTFPHLEIIDEMEEEMEEEGEKRTRDPSCLEVSEWLEMATNATEG